MYTDPCGSDFHFASSEQKQSLLVKRRKHKIKKMKKTIALFVSVFMITNVIAQVRMNADIEKTTLRWLGERVIGQEAGTIRLNDGWLEWRDNKIVSGEFTIDMTTIKDSKANAKLEGHLKSDDFFGVEKFPTSKLIITGSESFERGYAPVRGNLTIKGITNPIEFKAVMQKKEEGTRFYANVIFDRAKYNVRYGSGTFFDNLGDRTIFDEIKVIVDLLVR